ncbi:allantoate amidohydrolase [Azospirillum oleiclasticum]|nr:allantoate amidohydrolase [Azospirillum oleiclasticum]
MTTHPPPAPAAALMQQLADFAGFSDEEGALTRLYLSPAHREAVAWLRDRMTEAGMSVRLDPAATLIGRYEGTRPGLPAVLIGSHIDTVRNAGRYDGNFGVLAGVQAVAELNRRGERLPFAIEVLAFGDEEGVRFPVTLTGSRAIAGTVTPGAFDVADRDGVRHGDALRAFGGDPDRVGEAAKRPEDVLAYLELHIEQGPVLESEGLPVGVVTAINGARRFRITVGGMAGHAGTVPMEMRRDALTAAAEMILAIERRALAEPDLVATVGTIEALPGAVNVIPGRARFTIDLRAPQDSQRDKAAEDIRAALDGIAAYRRVTLAVEPIHAAPAAQCDPTLMDAFAAAIERAGIRPFRLPSGAGHDAMALATLCPVAMLFVRCKGGVSHNPAESITVDDAAVALDVLLDMLRTLKP